ncbi:MAG: S53 family peptidase [Aliidongia sp.]
MRVSHLALATAAIASTVALAPAGTQAATKTATVLNKADPNSTASFTMFLPLAHEDKLDALLAGLTDSSSANYHQWLSPAQFKTQFGPSGATIAQAKAILGAAGLTVTAENTQSLSVRGSVAKVEKFLSARLDVVQTARGNTKLAAHDQEMTMPDSLASLGAVIPEFTTHLQAHTHHMVLGTAKASGTTSGRLAAADAFFYANDMRESYRFPSFTTEVVLPGKKKTTVQLDGSGATIGIVISSTVLQSDINASFNSTVSTSATTVDVNNFSGNTTVPVPKPTIEPVLGGSGPFTPGTPDSDEASLDTQMSLGTAPGAHEVVYDMPDLTDASIVAAYTQVDEDNSVDVVSSSFGECELDFTAAANGGTDFTGILQVFHSLFKQGNAQGITFVVSSGDNGAPACTSTAFDTNPTNGTNFVLGVENPASDPAVTAVGGTNLQVSPTPTPNDATYLSENANFDPRVPAEFDLANGTSVTVGNNTWGSGGGVSVIFAKPDYQLLVATHESKKRSVPDVSLMMGGCPGDANIAAQDCTQLPRSAVIVWIGGVPNLLIGTSSAAPQMAGVLAQAVALGGRQGNVNPLIYTLSALQTVLGGTHAPASLQFFHRNIAGNNNGYTVTPGAAYSEVLGNGTLIVENFLGLPFAPPSGAPSTPSNP